MFYILFYIMPALAILGLLFAPYRIWKTTILKFNEELFWTEYPETRIVLIIFLFTCMTIAYFVSQTATVTGTYEENFYDCIEKAHSWSKLDVLTIKTCESFAAAAQIEIINKKLVEEFKLSQPNKEVIEAYKQQLELLKNK